MTTLCETCRQEIGTRTCPQCGGDIVKLGDYCYLCGGPLAAVVHEVVAEVVGDDDDFSKRILCSDGSCIGVVNEQGVCKVCGKPYTPESD